MRLYLIFDTALYFTLTHYRPGYFEQVHPIYPFLQRHEFERKALDNRCSQFCEECAPFSALYHTVLALGCQRLGGETFQLGCSPSWKLFQVALGLFAEMITTKETLVHVQVGCRPQLHIIITKNKTRL